MIHNIMTYATNHKLTNYISIYVLLFDLCVVMIITLTIYYDSLWVLFKYFRAVCLNPGKSTGAPNVKVFINQL